MTTNRNDKSARMSSAPREAALVAQVTLILAQMEKALAAVKRAQTCMQAGDFDQGADALLKASEPTHDADTLLRAFSLIEAPPID